MKIISRVVSVLLICLAIWLAASVVDVVFNNTTRPASYANWNVFEMFLS